jgi:hypothetical protein
MSSADNYIQLSSLPEDVRKQVLDFIDFLLRRKSDGAGKPRKTPAPGLAKGMVTVPDDFDAPLDDFKEYME